MRSRTDSTLALSPLRTAKRFTIRVLRRMVPAGRVHLEGIAAAGGKLVCQYTHDASSELKVFDANGKFESSIALPSLGSVSSPSGRWESSEFFYSFESYDSAPAIFRYNVKEAKSEVWASNKEVFDASGLEIEQIWYSYK